MADYRIKGGETDTEFVTIYATHSAEPGTYYVYASKDGSSHRERVLLWGVLADGSPVPITMGGAYDGIDQRNAFVLLPDGTCSRDGNQSWDSEADAIAELGKYEPS